MALALSSVKTFAEGNHKVKVCNVAFDSSYASGGESLTAANFGLYTITNIVISPTAGYFFEYDYANSKIKAYTQFNQYTVTVDPASMNTDTVANTQVTVTGVKVATDCITGVFPVNTLEAGIDVQQAWVSADDTVQLRLTNCKGSTVDPASGSWTLNVANTSGALKEVKSAFDLSGLTGVRVQAKGF